MKCESHGKLNLNTKIAERLNFQNASIIQLQFISNLFIFKPVSPAKVALVCLKILIVQKG